MTIAEYAVTLVRAVMAAEIAMASVNCGAANVTRAQAERLLGDYFGLVEQVIPWTEINHLDCRSSIRAPAIMIYSCNTPCRRCSTAAPGL
jgi:hypothetical protein